MSQPKSSRPTPKSGRPAASGAGGTSGGTGSGTGGGTGTGGPKGPVRTSAMKSARQSSGATLTVEQDSAAETRASSPAAEASSGAQSRPAAASSARASDPVDEGAPVRPAGPRRVRLSVSRIDPWSVMKMGFLLSVAAGIMTVVAAAVAWTVLDSMGVFADLQSLVSDLGATAQFGPILEYLKLNNIMSMATIVAVVNVALITALATLFAFLYNIVAALVGGLHMTLTDD